MKAERWVSVVGLEGRYEVSDRGRVRASETRKIRVLAVGRASYNRSKVVSLRVTLRKGGRQQTFLVHRLVLEAFVGPCPVGMESRHYPDSDPANNKLANLSWATQLVNQRDRFKHGTHNRGTNSPMAKLDDAKVQAIRKVKHWPYGSLVEAARQLGVSVQLIRDVRSGKRWRHV